MLAALVLQAALDATAPVDADAVVRSLLERRRRHEQALDTYTYDIVETREELDGRGRVRERHSRSFEVFHVEGRPVRRLVAEDGVALDAGAQAAEDRRAQALARAIRQGDVVTEKPGVRISALIGGYRFRCVGREPVGDRDALVLEFAERDPGATHGLPGGLAGRLWVDAAQHELLRLEMRNTRGIRIALGLGASVSTLEFELEFVELEAGVWLPRRWSALIEGRKLLFRRFRRRLVVSWSGFRRFEVDLDEAVGPGG